VLIVEHNMPFLLPLADSILCLDEGRTIAEGTPDSVRRNPAVIAAYLGTP
jgi:branched-chain amino acid transport system permease protein